MEQGTATQQAGTSPLTNTPAVATISTTDVKRSFDFYTKKVGLKKVEFNEGTGKNDGFFVVGAGGGTNIFVYTRESAPKAENTAITFKVDKDFMNVVKTLKGNGITFEQYDGEGGVTTNQEGISEDDGFKGAWFKDPDGNIVAVMQMPSRK